MRDYFKVTSYTDHSFQKYCSNNYGINRGVYNVINQWFYEKGITNIQIRRKEILQFLEYINAGLDQNNQKKASFGKGGLSIKLEEYWCEKKEIVLAN